MSRLLPLVIATKNKGKSSEIKKMLTGFPVDVRDLSDFGPMPEAVEDGESFDENAYIKSSHTARILGFPALADDSGLCVQALGGKPGVHSARYAGPDADDMTRCSKILSALKGNPDRRAAFECVISIAVPSGAALTYEARCEGLIAEAPAGDDGFGYDPIFYYPPLDRTFAQLSPEEKNSVSHRGKALAEMRAEFDKVLIWIAAHLSGPFGSNEAESKKNGENA